MKRTLGLLAALAAVALAAPSAHARSEYKAAFLNLYGATGTALDTCDLCHVSKQVRNPYGQAVEARLPVSDAVFIAIEDIDSDGDGYTNIEEILALTFPGDATSKPSTPTCIDNDGDGYGTDCAAGPDCDDADFFVNPGAAEVECDGIDNDCDLATDDLVDLDGDGVTGCGGLDCNDTDPSINPGAAEICTDLVDNDCDGFVDYDDTADCTTPTCTDADTDGFYAEAGCGTAVDCNDGDAAINPGAAEVECDGIDNDCNSATLDQVDADGDGFTGCGGLDCDDADPNNFPGNPEVCGDAGDNDCDGLVDYDDPDCGEAPVCADWATKAECNADLACVWVGSPRSGSCEDSTCTPTEANETTCDDGVDSDCDGAVDCADSDCSADPVCEAPDCSAFADKDTCNAEAMCRWSPKDKACVAA